MRRGHLSNKNADLQETEEYLLVPSSTRKPLVGFSPWYPPVLGAKLQGSWVNKPQGKTQTPQRLCAVALESLGHKTPVCRQVTD